jgi:hypothetical protein
MAEAVEDDNLGSDLLRAKSLVAGKQSRKIERERVIIQTEKEKSMDVGIVRFLSSTQKKETNHGGNSEKELTADGT